MTHEAPDLVVVGSGVAGLTAALRADAAGLDVVVVTKAGLDDATTRWAQGGVAAVLDDHVAAPDAAVDSLDLHVADTLAAGAGLCDPAAVRCLVAEGAAAVTGLLTLGAHFDRDGAGALELGREGGHSTARIVHAGGAATGAEIERVLVDAVAGSAIEVRARTFTADLLVEDGCCVGLVLVGPDGTVEELRSGAVLLAAGGAGQLHAVTTNPPQSTGDGVAMALRAGVACADLEFVQFHPTALAVDRTPRPLLTEALRGEGAVLRDGDGERFVDELAPRDVVSRAMTRRMLDTGRDHLWLDATGVPDVAARFPTIAAGLAAAGLDPAIDWLPVAPAAHYLCGGILTDLDGATTLPGLWAAGEVACSGVHGANRLASNSLLEGLVFGARAVDAVVSGRRGASASGAMASWLTLAPADGSGVPGAVALALPEPDVVGTARRGVDPAGLDTLRRAMTTGAGLQRDAASLADAASVVTAVGERVGDGSVAALEMANLVVVARAAIAAAEARTESRGTHTRVDFPDTDASQCHRLVVGGRSVTDSVAGLQTAAARTADDGGAPGRPGVVDAAHHGGAG